MWNGDLVYLMQNLILKDFRVRYRNMSLGVLWSVLNPLVMMAVLTFVFVKIFPNNTQKHFPVFCLCGIIPFNFFALAWSSGTNSIIENVGLIKRVPVPREIVPISAVLSNCVHLAIQMGLLLAVVLVSGIGANQQWLWLPILWGVEVVFVCGLALASAALNVYIRDTRYVVESFTTVLFWLVPIFYSFEIIPLQYKEIYQFNPVAALVLSLRNVLLDATAPPTMTVLKLTAVSFATFFLGLTFFRRMSVMFFEHI